MDRDELLRELRRLAELSKAAGDLESIHGEADALLLQFIDDTEVSEAFVAIEKWYA